MGDFMGLAMHIEAAFEIDLSDEDCRKLSTVEDLYSCVVAKLEHNLGPSVPNTCLSSVTFYRMRRELMEWFGVERKAVTLRSDLAAFFPLRNRRRDWRLFEAALGLQLPELQLPGFLELTVLACFTIPILIGLGTLFAGLPSVFLLLVIAGLLFGRLVSRLLTPFQTHLPCTTMRELTTETLSMNYTTVAKKQGRWSEREVRHMLREFIAHDCALKPEEVKGEAELVDDLGME